MFNYKRDVHTERNIKYLNLDKDIFDKDFSEVESKFFGLFKTRRTFKLRNDMSEVSKNEPVKGFKK